MLLGFRNYNSIFMPPLPLPLYYYGYLFFTQQKLINIVYKTGYSSIGSKFINFIGVKPFRLIVSFIVVFTGTLSSQNHTVSGTLKDAANGESLIGATVYLKENNN